MIGFVKSISGISRTLSFSLFIVSVFVLIGCSSDVVSNQKTENVSAVPEDYKIDFARIGGSKTKYKVVVTIPVEIRTQIEKPDRDILSLVVLDKNDWNSPGIPVLGDVTSTETGFEFTPKFPLVPGESYVARFDPTNSDALKNNSLEMITATLEIKRVQSDLPEITAIYPSSGELPANHLKFYLRFSQPMQQGGIFGYFSLFNLTQGKQVPRPFRHTELWSPDGQQLTLWFHPGRQKEGVNLNEEIGPILKPGDQYVLRISNEWKALFGGKFKAGYEKRFVAAEPDLAVPDMKKWKFQIPKADGRSPFVCELGESLDWALLQSTLRILNSGDQLVKGKITVGDNETRWEFVPERSWKPGIYKLVADPVLEDLAGNSLESPFAVDLKQKIDPKSADTTRFEREFQILP